MCESLPYAQQGFLAFPVHNLQIFGGISHFAARRSSQVTLYTSALVICIFYLKDAILDFCLPVTSYNIHNSYSEQLYLGNIDKAV